MAVPVQVALALGSGGARGYAHIGAIEVIESRGLGIVGVAGSSMGALVGGLYAADGLAEYTEWAVSLSQLDVVRLLDVSLAAGGVIRADRIFGRVRRIVGDRMIEDLRMPFTAVTTDLTTGRTLWLQRGSLEVAIRASSAIPGVIGPVQVGRRVLADGGIVDPLPVAPTAGIDADLTIGVSVGVEEPAVDHDRDGRTGDSADPRRDPDPRAVEEWIGRFRRGATNFLDREVVRTVRGRFGSRELAVTDATAVDDSSFGDPTFADRAGYTARAPERPDLGPDVVEDAEGADTTRSDPAGPGDSGSPGVEFARMSRFDVMNRSIEIMQAALARYQMAAHPPDVLVRVPRRSARSLDFHRARDLIELGRGLTEEALDAAGLVAPTASGAAPGGADRPTGGPGPGESGVPEQGPGS